MGNKDTLEWLKSLSPNFVMARGDQDEMVGLPLTKKINIKGVEFGVVHGHQIVPWEDEESLKSVQRELGCDVLVYGHSHKRGIKSVDGVYYVNPGSATGSYSSLEM